MTLEKINSLSDRDAHTLFHLACGSRKWSEEMVARRPFTNPEQLYAVAEEIWGGLSEDDWKEAFAQHPRIGDTKEIRKKFGRASAWMLEEQSGANHVSERVLKAIADGNALYEAKFGFIFIVCATGKTAEEMLALLNERLNNYPAREIAIAAAEQAKITRLRLEKILNS
jgi:2-oxo-4-hydroxy-4-carboxy-5-ureidoimidazoline decarboxylase